MDWGGAERKKGRNLALPGRRPRLGFRLEYINFGTLVGYNLDDVSCGAYYIMNGIRVDRVKITGSLSKRMYPLRVRDRMSASR